MNNSEILSPQTFLLLQDVEDAGSFAGAAREQGLVPSELSNRISKIQSFLLNISDNEFRVIGL